MIGGADVVIGPYLSKNLKVVSDYCRDNGKVLISPWNSTEVVTDNPDFYQMRPSLTHHCEALLKYAKSKNLNEEILIISDATRNTGIVDEIQNFHKKLEGNPNVKDLNHYAVRDINSSNIIEEMTNLWTKDSIRSIVVPIWSPESFVISLLSKINFAKANREITVYGLPQWMDMQRMDFALYENLNVHVSSVHPIINNTPKRAAFRNHYFSTYGTLPDQDTYYGLDFAEWFQSTLGEHGLDFSTPPSSSATDQLFDFMTVMSSDGEFEGYRTNTHIDILRFDNYKFESVKK
jgi:hypothetical protein